MDFLHTTKNYILNILFPISCVSCRKRDSYLCLDCLSSSPRANEVNEDWIFPILSYQHTPIKKALWLLKYKDKKPIAKIFAKILYEKIIEELEELRLMHNFYKPIILAVPLSSKRLRERGYNQSEILVKEIMKLDQESIMNTCEDLLLKTKETEHQTNIKNRTERLNNIIDSFEINKDLIETVKGQNIILIDDVVTTGATLGELRRILDYAGAKNVIAFTVAH